MRLTVWFLFLTVLLAAACTHTSIPPTPVLVAMDASAPEVVLPKLLDRSSNSATVNYDAGALPPPITLRRRGVNLSGAEFAETKIPGVHGTDYLWPTPATVDYFTKLGANHFRVPFLHERIQPKLQGPLDVAELTRMKAVVDYATKQGATVLVDPHNYFRYRGVIVSETQIGDLWGRLANEFKGNPLVQFDVTNEPHDMTSEQVVALNNAALKEIRRVGATNLVVAAGNGWAGALNWPAKWYGTPNTVAMLDVIDPGANLAFGIHVYLDADGGGGKDCVSPTIGVERLRPVVVWLRQNGRRGIIGEVAGINTPVCKAAVAGTLAYVEANYDVWLSWAAWGGGVWSYGATYPMALGPPLSGQPEKAPLAWYKGFWTSCGAQSLATWQSAP